jgi:hypothetical protein
MAAATFWRNAGDRRSPGSVNSDAELEIRQQFHRQIAIAGQHARLGAGRLDHQPVADSGGAVLSAARLARLYPAYCRTYPARLVS